MPYFVCILVILYRLDGDTSDEALLREELAEFERRWQARQVKLQRATGGWCYVVDMKAFLLVQLRDDTDTRLP